MGKKVAVLTDSNSGITQDMAKEMGIRVLPMPFAAFCGQTTGLKKAVKEYFKTSGISCIGIVVCDNTSKRNGVPSAKLNQIQRLIRKI